MMIDVICGHFLPLVETNGYKMIDVHSLHDISFQI
jgi:hypothetical protein